MFSHLNFLANLELVVIWVDKMPVDDGYISIYLIKFEVCDPRSRLRTVPTIVIAHTFCASRDTRVSYR